MFKNVRQVKINNKEFQYRVLNASEGIKVSLMLLTHLPTNEITGMDDLSVIASIMKNIGTDEIFDIIIKMIGDVAVDGQDIKFDDYFSANYGELLELVAHAFKENFGSFFTANLTNLLGE